MSQLARVAVRVLALQRWMTTDDDVGDLDAGVVDVVLDAYVVAWS